MKVFPIGFIAVVLTLFSNTAVGQTLGWVKGMGNSNLGAAGNSITVDSMGNVYTVGLFAGTVDFDPGLSVFNLTSSGTLHDAFIQKLNPSGNLIWAKKVGNGNVS